MMDRTFLITGGTGSLGQYLVRFLGVAAYTKKIVIYSRDEYKQHLLKKHYQDINWPYLSKLRFCIGDVRDRERLTKAMNGISHVIHTAALKQQDIVAYNFEEAIKTNIDGSMNVVNACIDAGVTAAFNISSDKAVKPIGLYGGTKQVAEHIFLSGNVYSGKNGTKFRNYRFGNMIGSRGSFTELLINLKEKHQLNLYGGECFGPVGVCKQPIPVTDLNMVRYWISLRSAASFICRTAIDIDCHHWKDETEVKTPPMTQMRVRDVISQYFREYKTIKIDRGVEKKKEDLPGVDVIHPADLPNDYFDKPQLI